MQPCVVEPVFEEDVDTSDLDHVGDHSHARCIACYPTVKPGDLVVCVCGVTVLVTHVTAVEEPVKCEECLAVKRNRYSPRCGHGST